LKGYKRIKSKAERLSRLRKAGSKRNIQEKCRTNLYILVDIRGQT